MTDVFRSCSGQSYFTRQRNPNAPDWGICLADDFYLCCPWWRAEDRAGRQRRFRTFDDAERYRAKLEARMTVHRSEVRRLSGALAPGDAGRSAFGEAVTALLNGGERVS